MADETEPQELTDEQERDLEAAARLLLGAPPGAPDDELEVA